MTTYVSSYTPQERQFIADNAPKLTTNQMASHLNKSKQSILMYLRQNGFSFAQYPNMYPVRHELFMTQHTPEAVYLLGYLWADGYLDPSGHNVTINCTKDDMDDAEWIFDKTGEWNKTAFSRKGQKPTRTFRTFNHLLYDYLVEHGYRTKSKDSPTKILSKIPDHLKHYFWRGYFDGDGCVYVSKKGHGCVVISGSYDQDWSSLIKLSEQLGVRFTVTQRVRDKHSWTHVCMHVQLHIKRFLGWIYQGYDIDQIGLKRKKDKTNQLNHHIETRNVGKSGFVGVEASRTEAVRYYARITARSRANKETIYLGLFDTAEEAAICYDKEAVKRRGLRARTNFPIENYLPLVAK